jgi:hypothetical protein
MVIMVEFWKRSSQARANGWKGRRLTHSVGDVYCRRYETWLRNQDLKVIEVVRKVPSRRENYIGQSLASLSALVPCFHMSTCFDR